MGFLLYTKDSIHFCILYTDICLFNIDIFLATFCTFFALSSEIFFYTLKNTSFLLTVPLAVL